MQQRHFYHRGRARPGLEPLDRPRAPPPPRRGHPHPRRGPRPPPARPRLDTSNRRATSRRPRPTRQHLRAGAAMTIDTTPQTRGARRPRAHPRDPARPRCQGQGRRRPARRGHPRGARPPAREGVPLPDHAGQHARGPARARRRVHRRPVGLPDARRDPAEARAMSATKPGRELASPDSRRRPRATRSKPQRVPLSTSDPAIGARAAGGRDSPSPRPATSTHAPPDTRSR